MNAKLLCLTLVTAAVVAGISWSPLNANEPPPDATAFQLMKEGNKYVGEQSKDKVVQVRAEKSIGTTVPNIWYVVYYDHTATLKSVEVKFAAGKMVSVERPLRLLEPIFGGSEPLNPAKLKVDSDEAIRTALKEPLLAKLKVVATAPKLEDSEMGPVWRVRLWALKLNDPSTDVNIGEVVISPDTGEVMKRDLHIARVD